MLVVSAPEASGGHVEQFRVDDLLGLAQDVHEFASAGRVLWREEGVRRAGVVGAARAPNPVNVILRRGRVVKVDDELHVVHI